MRWSSSRRYMYALLFATHRRRRHVLRPPESPPPHDASRSVAVITLRGLIRAPRFCHDDGRHAEDASLRAMRGACEAKRFCLFSSYYITEKI